MNFNLIQFLKDIYSSTNQINGTKSLVNSIFYLVPNIEKHQLLADVKQYILTTTTTTTTNNSDNQFILFLLSIIYDIIDYQKQESTSLNEIINEILKIYINYFINSNQQNEMNQLSNIISKIIEKVSSVEIFNTFIDLIKYQLENTSNNNKLGYYIIHQIVNNDISSDDSSIISTKFYSILVPVLIDNLENYTIIGQHSKQQSLIILSKIMLDKGVLGKEIELQLEQQYNQEWLPNLWRAITTNSKDIYEKLKLAFFFHGCYFDCIVKYFKKKEPIPFNLLAQPQYWEILYQSLIDKDSLPRKQGIHLLKNTISLAQPIWKQFLPQNWSTKQWNLFYSLYESFDETKSHLFIPVWVQMNNLLNDSQDSFTNLSNPKSIYFWIGILFLRGFNHVNINIRKRVIADCLSSDFISNNLISIPFDKFSSQIINSFDSLEISTIYENENKLLLKFLSNIFKNNSNIEYLEILIQYLATNVGETKTIVIFLNCLKPILFGYKITTSILESCRNLLNTHPIAMAPINVVLSESVLDFLLAFEMDQSLNISFILLSKIFSSLSKYLVQQKKNLIQEWLPKSNWIINQVVSDFNQLVIGQEENYETLELSIHSVIRALGLCENDQVLGFCKNQIKNCNNEKVYTLSVQIIFQEFNNQIELLDQIYNEIYNYQFIINSIKNYINNQEENFDQILNQFKFIESISKLSTFSKIQDLQFIQYIENLILNNQSFDLKKLSIILLVYHLNNNIKFDNDNQILESLLKLEPKYKFDSTISFILPKFIQFKWLSISNLLQRQEKEKIETENLKIIFKECINNLDNATGFVLVPIFECLKICIDNNVMEDMENMFKQIYLSYSDSSRKPISLTKSFINLLFHPTLFKTTESIPLVKEYLEKTLNDWGESVRISCGLLGHCCAIWASNPECLDEFINEIIDLCLLTSEDRLVIEDEEDQNHTLFNNHGYIIRWFVSQLEGEKTKSFVEKLMIELLELNFKPEFSKREYSQQSKTNKMKCKLWRTLCSLTHIIDLNQGSMEFYSKVNNTMWKTLELKNHGNVRYLIQLFIINILIKASQSQIDNNGKELIDRIENAINSDYQMSASLIIISSSYLYYLLNKQFSNQSLILNLFKMIIPWTTDFHHAVRTTAQLAIYSILSKKYEILKEFNDNDMLKSMYHYLDTHKIQKRLREKQTLFIQNDDPLFKTLAENILTSNTNTIQDENEEEENNGPVGNNNDDDDDFGQLSVNQDESIIPMSLLDISKRLIKDFQVSFQNNIINHETKNPPNTIAEKVLIQENNTDDDSDILDFQKRITPWQWVQKLEEHHQINNNNSNNNNNNKNNSKRQSMIIVGTFIENTPNLAGLIRTCEIFNVEQVAIPNIKLLNDPQFQRVSVSAEKWVPTIEVTKPNLISYLTLKKKEGYSILGVEQTSQSKNLSTFEFPKKCVLLLGQEQNGIPAEYLNIVDYCIEIPQLGQIRSLNVHVSASIMIWEYTQQQILASNNNN
ncbi:hypothetical protein CYY_008683 [Polysphondylium violaceum]|uniref:tRNA (guanosine(18)-2'-O)-methyltransferase TARBP1 n=1 Tax=Polysphondylium violaceum TaxID=133409 RepID=A0A8J4PL80_9MYCE|nr:hypothetical protein CYY_008683 [Polysphondylium violaceum]